MRALLLSPATLALRYAAIHTCALRVALQRLLNKHYGNDSLALP
jgi:hypothetical protein